MVPGEVVLSFSNQLICFWKLSDEHCHVVQYGTMLYLLVSAGWWWMGGAYTVVRMRKDKQDLAPSCETQGGGEPCRGSGSLWMILEVLQPCTFPVCYLLPVLLRCKETEESQRDAPVIMACLQCLPLRDGLEL